MKIVGVFHRRATLSNQDWRRRLFTVFNGDLGGFVAAQMKWFEFKRDAWVGGHYHEYEEMFCIVKGKGTYDLVSVDQPEQREQFSMGKGDILLVPRRVAHRAYVLAGSLILAANSEPYVSATASDFPFDFRTSSPVGKAND